MTSTQDHAPFPPEKREKLLNILHPRRIGHLFHYIMGLCLFLLGLIFFIAATAGVFPINPISWSLGVISLSSGVGIITWEEVRIRNTMYILTTWNIRLRSGFRQRNTSRVFYDDIAQVKTSRDPGEKIAEMGDIEVYSKNDSNIPILVFQDVRYPEGIKEIIQRFVETTAYPTPWDHIDK
ncbi:MAG: PH domain-containing protein [Candidatus Thorarchaeota archaeon]